MRTFRWLVCHKCGWEHHVVGMSPICPECGGDLYFHSTLDGELPKRLKKHHPSCGNQNVLDPGGAYRGVEKCGCNKYEN